MSADDSRYRTRAFEAGDAPSGFRCGKHSLDDYFRRHAGRNDSLGIGRTFVLPRAPDESALPAVLGYYTLSMADVLPDEVREFMPSALPRYPLPVALLGRLAVDERAHGRRLGEALLIDAPSHIGDASTLLGCVGVIVDALDEGAAGFYAAYDFEPIGDDRYPRRMFLPIATMREALRGDP